MDTQNIDQLFRKALEASEGHYDAQANNARQRIWKQVQPAHRKTRRVVLISLAAACIILFFISSFLGFSLFRSKKSIYAQDFKIKQLSAELANTRAIITGKSVADIPSSFPSIDTVYVENEKIVNVPVEIAKTLIDTVYITQIVYLEKEVEATTVKAIPQEKDIDLRKDEKTQVRNTEILISSTETLKKSRTKRLQIRLGGERDQSNSGTLALIAKY